MRRILIVGGGQSGLQLALSLLEYDYDVTVMTVRTADELFDGRAVSVQILYDDARRPEREYRLNFWDEKAPSIAGMRITAHDEQDQPVFDWTGWLDAPAQSVDERVKMSAWLRAFEERGGKVIIHGAASSDLDYLSRMFDLTIVAAGHSGLAEIFSVDTSRKLARMPQVATAIAHIEDSENHPDQNRVGVDLVPSVGHIISWPTYSVRGRCRLLFVTGPTSGPLSRWPRQCPPQTHLDLMLEVMREVFPLRYEDYRDARLADDNAVAMDYANPQVRHPVGQLPSGRMVMGMGDTVVVTSPALQQDANNASKAAEVYLKSILEQGDRPFDEDFMHRTFARYMDYAQYFTGEIAAALHEVSPYVVDMCLAADHRQQLADRFANGFNDPADLGSWFAQESTTRALIEQIPPDD